MDELQENSKNLEPGLTDAKDVLNIKTTCHTIKRMLEHLREKNIFRMRCVKGTYLNMHGAHQPIIKVGHIKIEILHEYAK